MTDSESLVHFNRPFISGRELAYVADVLANRRLAGDGAYTKRCHALLESITGAKHALLTSSCTDALEMAALLYDVGPGDEIIVPSFTFVSTVNAFVLRGARPIFIDIRPDTLNVDERLLERHLSPKTRAIVVVHYAGVAADMDAILAIAARAGVPVIEDNAHGLFGSYRGRRLGSLGALATLSFHETKNVSSGEGGALLVNDARLAARAEIVREKGTNRGRFFRGEVDKYTWVDVGSSFLPSEISAAVLLAQLEARATIQAARQRIWETYARELRPWADRVGVALPTVPAWCEQPYHLFYLLLPSLDARSSLIAHLRARGVHAVFHYLPLHLSEMGIRWGGKTAECPVTERVSDCILRLPLYPDLTESELARVISAVQSFAGA